MSKDLRIKKGIGIVVIGLIALSLVGYAGTLTIHDNADQPEKYVFDTDPQHDLDEVSDVYQFESLEGYDQNLIEDLEQNSEVTVENPPDESKLVESEGDSVSVILEDGEEIRFDVDDDQGFSIYVTLAATLLGFLSVGLAGAYSIEDNEPTVLVVTLSIVIGIFLI